jgi:hypothetical protein
MIKEMVELLAKSREGEHAINLSAPYQKKALDSLSAPRSEPYTFDLSAPDPKKVLEDLLTTSRLEPHAVSSRAVIYFPTSQRKSHKASPTLPNSPSLVLKIVRHRTIRLRPRQLISFPQNKILCLRRSEDQNRKRFQFPDVIEV